MTEHSSPDCCTIWGKLAAASFFPKKLEQAISTAKKRNCSLLDAEIKIFNTHHAEIGAFLAEWWALPPFIVNAISWHHSPQSTPIEKDVLAATHVANLLTYKFHYGSGEGIEPGPLEDSYKEKFYLNDEAIEILRMETEKTITVLNH